IPCFKPATVPLQFASLRSGGSLVFHTRSPVAQDLPLPTDFHRRTKRRERLPPVDLDDARSGSGAVIDDGEDETGLQGAQGVFGGPQATAQAFAAVGLVHAPDEAKSLFAGGRV